jgi:AraC-like DNA-binding protein
LPSLATSSDPLAIALDRKARMGRAGATEATAVAAGDGWQVRDIVCTSGRDDRPFEERHAGTSISLVLSGTFVYRTARGASLMSSGALLLGNEGQAFECGHDHGEGDRCLSFRFEPELFGRVARDAGVRRPMFAHDRLPPLRVLAPLAVRAAAALGRPDALEEVALELAAAVVRVAGPGVRPAPVRAPDPTRVARVIRDVESRVAERHTLEDMARTAGLSRWHFLRAFRAVTGVTPHQWVLRARLRTAAERLVHTRAPVTEIALDAGFDDLSNFIRTFRAEFGASPRRYRLGATS